MKTTQKKMAIFGCGYLGERVAREALERGLVVTALTRNSSQAAVLQRLGVHRVITAELDGNDWHRQIEPRQDFVVNCVGSGGGGMPGYRKSYLEGMRSLVQWAQAGDSGALVFTGSTSVYDQDHEEWVDESAPVAESSGTAVILGEAEAVLSGASLGTARRFILRLGGIYGPGRHWLLNRALRGAEAEEGDDVFLNSIHVDDVVAAIWAAFSSRPEVSGGTFNIVDGNPARKGEIVGYLHERVTALGLVSDEGPPPGLSRRRQGARPNRRISNEKARVVLGWVPRYPDFRAGYEILFERMAAEKRAER